MPENRTIATEALEIERRYRRRSSSADNRYDPVSEYSMCFRQDRERSVARVLRRAFPSRSAREQLRVLEIGCGQGSKLLELLLLGLRPENLTGIELIADFAAHARLRLPPSVRIIEGDAVTTRLDETFDVVYQCTVFTSILSDGYRRELAERSWRWVRPGGGVLWYDFAYNNPANPDVRGVGLREVRQLFPAGRIAHWRHTLAPPLGRVAAAIHPGLYDLLNALPLLRTHMLCWIRRDEDTQ